MRRKTLTLLLTACAVAHNLRAAGAEPASAFASIFPAAEWQTAEPEQLKLSREAIDGIGKLMKQAEANGVLVCKGFLAAQWNFGGPPEQQFETQSITKSIIGMLLGVAVKDGLIPSLDAKVKNLFPAFDAGPHTRDITFRHLISATSGIGSTITQGRYVDPGGRKPGEACQYHNDHCHHLARALTYLFETDLEDILRARLLNRIGAQDDVMWGAHQSVTLSNNREVRVVAGYAFSNWSARDLARVGHLYLNAGEWDGEQLLPRGYVKECWTPVSVPVLEWSTQPPSDRDMSRMTYGLSWRGWRYRDGGILWYMSGNGGQFCVVLPEAGVVVTKINRYDKTPHIGFEHFEPFLLEISSLSAEASANM